MNIPVVMVATDFKTGQKVVLKSGSNFDALRANTSVPGLFAPAGVKDRWFVDGGLVDLVPVSVAISMGADIIIAVYLSSGNISRKKQTKQKNFKIQAPIAQTMNRNELL